MLHVTLRAEMISSNGLLTWTHPIMIYGC
jgi:hypothetical protein